MSYTEDQLVQKTTADYLQDQLGWESVFAFNEETYGADGTLGREDQTEVILTRYLRDALKRLNPEAGSTLIDLAINEIVRYDPAKTLVHQNQEMYQLFKEGVKVELKNEDGEMDRVTLKIFDFDNPENNHFLAVREMWVQGSLYRRRPDIIGFVNGIPLLFVELKNVHKDIKTAYTHNFSDYKDTIPHIFTHNAIVMLSNGDVGRVGTITSPYEHFHEWKRLEEDDVGSVDFETMLKGICRKDRFMDLFENFILYDTSDGEAAKILARNHQYLGVNRAYHNFTEDQDKTKLGVFWHTQGSGKSYSMIFFAQKIHRKVRGNFTFLVMTDRKELDEQIYNRFLNTDSLHNDEVWAQSGNELKQLLESDNRYIFSLIHKFHADVNEPYSGRDDIIVISDEAHRTQYGTLALNMRKALPNASFIGFTGTPLFKDDELTKQVFGDYVSTYDFKRAIDDGATVPLYYESRGEKLQLTTNEINQRIADKLEEYNLDPDEEAKLEKELNREYHILTNDNRLDRIAQDFVDHYSERWMTGKAMFVCIDKLTTVRMYDLIQKYWEEKIERLEKELSREDDEELRRQLDWMKETERIVVISEEQGEVEYFRNHGLDIKPHRQVLKTRDVEAEFKDPNHPFRVAIVCAMWLTGFDVKPLSTLYLDKPLKGHTLMQAIARANRVYEDKDSGLIIDYVGVLKSLRKALAIYATGGYGEPIDGDPVKPKEELIAEMEEVLEEITHYLTTLGYDLSNLPQPQLMGFEKIREIKDAVDAVYTNDESKKRFEILARDVFRKFKALLPDPAADEYRKDYEAIDTVYKKLQDNREAADVSDIINSLREIIDDAVLPVDEMRDKGKQDYGTRINIGHIDFEKLKEEFAKSERKNTAVHSLKEMVEMKLQQMIELNPTRIDYYQRYQDIIEEYNKEKDQVTIERTFQQLLEFMDDLSEEETRAIEEDLNEEYLAVFDLIKKPKLNKSDYKRVKEISRELLDALKESKLSIEKWREKPASQSDVKIFIYDFLYENLPESSYTDDDVEMKTGTLFNHIYEKYPSSSQNIYVGIN